MLVRIPSIDGVSIRKGFSLGGAKNMIMAGEEKDVDGNSPGIKDLIKRGLLEKVKAAKVIETNDEELDKVEAEANY